jgi:hypothetical protein
MISTHMRGSGIEKEVEICATNITNKVKCMSANEMKKGGREIVKTCNICYYCHLWSKTLTLETETLWKPMKNLSRHTDLLCELETS